MVTLGEVFPRKRPSSRDFKFNVRKGISEGGHSTRIEQTSGKANFTKSV